MAEQKMTFEQAREELAETVKKLESGSVTLDESLALWERGEKLVAICQEYLDNVRKKLDDAKESN